MRKTLKQLQGESDYWRIKYINEQKRAEAAEAKLAELEKQELEEATWIENTGQMPVPKGTLVEVQHADGDILIGKAGEYGYANTWGLSSGPGTIIKWRLAKEDESDEEKKKIDEKSVDSVEVEDVVLPHQDRGVWIDWSGGKCPVEQGVLVDVKYRDGEEKFSLPALEKVRGRDTTIAFWRNDGYKNDIVAYRVSPENTKETTEMTTNTTNAQNTEAKLVPFCVCLDTVTARQVNEILSLAVEAGAEPVESTYDGELDSGEVGSEFPLLAGTGPYYRNNFRYAGVDTDNETYLLDSQASYGNNVLTYEEAKSMLLAVKGHTSTVEGKQKMPQQKPELKSFYVNLHEVDKDSERVNKILERFVALGAERHDLAHNDGNESSVRSVANDNGGYSGTVCYVDTFNLFGLKNLGNKLVTYINDVPRQWDKEAVKMSVAEVEALLKALEKPAKKSKVPQLRQRKLYVNYTNGKGYLLKNVVGVDVKADSSTVNVTYTQRKGKVQMNVNVVIPFSELVSVKFVGPNTIGAEYIFKSGKVSQVIQDYSRIDFTHKNH